MTHRNKRWRVFADAKMQGIFCARIVAYWLACQIAMCVTIVGIASLEGPGPSESGSVLRFIMPAFFVSLLILPIALFDALVFTNRIAGPLLSFRRKFSQLVATGNAEQFHVRRKDFFCDLAENFNLLREKVLQQQGKDNDANEKEVAAGRAPATVR